MVSEAFNRVPSYACGMVDLIVSRLVEHQQDHDNRMPRQFVLHPVSAAALRADAAKKFGMAEDGAFAGTPYTVCQCGKEFPVDLLIRWDGVAEPL